MRKIIWQTESYDETDAAAHIVRIGNARQVVIYRLSFDHWLWIAYGGGGDHADPRHGGRQVRPVSGGHCVQLPRPAWYQAGIQTQRIDERHGTTRSPLGTDQMGTQRSPDK